MFGIHVKYMGIRNSMYAMRHKIWRRHDRSIFRSEQHLTTILHLTTPFISKHPAFNAVPLLSPRFFCLFQPKDLLQVPLLTSHGHVVIFVEIDLAQEEHVLAAHQVGAPRDVGVEFGGLGRSRGRHGDEVAFGGGGEDEVGKLVPGAEDADQFPSVAEDEDKFLFFGWDPLESTCRHASLSIL